MNSDSTQVTGSPISARGPRRGTVLGERYEILESLDGDALALTYKALDQESEAHVLFRLPAPGVLGERDARALVTRLSPLVGIGGRTLARIRDVDREGALVFVVEPWPQGTTFRAILEARRDKGSVFSTTELLPVIVALAEATMAIPSPWFHGDLRAHRVYVSSDGVRVTGGFVLSVLPGDSVVDALTDDVGLRRQFAPEVGDGLAGRPSDRWSVAALAWEALTGHPPEPGPKHAPISLGELGKVLVRYLDPDPTLRPPTLELLVTTLAKHANTSAPKLAPEPFAVESQAPSDERTQQLDASDLGPPDSGQAGLPKANDTAKMQAVVLSDAPTVKDASERDLSDIDPALLKAAALNRKMSDSGTFKLDANELQPVTGQQKGVAPRAGDSGELDPRLVRAALGLDDGTDPRGEPAKEPVKARPGARTRPAAQTQELDALDLEVVPAKAAANTATRASAPNMAAPKAAPPIKSIPPGSPSKGSIPSARPMPAPKPMPVAAPRPQPAVQPAPRPVVQHVIQPRVQPAVQPAVQPILHAPVATAPPAVVPAPRAFQDQPSTRIDRPARERGNGTLIIAIAIGVAVTILVLAFWFRSAQQESARQRQIDERVRQIQDQ